MRRMRQLLLVTWVVCALPATAFGQWATSATEHDWRFNLGGNSYGLVQRVTYFTTFGAGGISTTTICLGPCTTNTRVPAANIALIMLLPVGSTGLLLLSRLLPRNRV
jgi:hypothetical protein